MLFLTIFNLKVFKLASTGIVIFCKLVISQGLCKIFLLYQIYKVTLGVFWGVS
jgi:hypothetical protein